jgi:hypothetical protein
VTPDRPSAAPEFTDPTSTLTGGDAGGAASLDKVRDILFGAQSREYERRLIRLEERLAKETADLRDDMRQRLEVLEAFVRRESESLADRLTRERDERTSVARDLAGEIKDVARTHEQTAAAFDERMAREQRELRQQMLDQYNRLSETLREKTDDLVATIAREAHELRNEKASRAVLASLLTEMAMRLNHEFRIPGDGDPRD